MEQIGLYLGCNIPLKHPDIEQSFRKILPELGVEPVDLEGAGCCPAWGTAPSFDLAGWCSLSSRNITIAEEKGVDVMTGCNSCFGILSEAKHFLEDKELRTTVNEKLAQIDREFKGEADIFHIAQYLHKHIGTETIESKIKYSLEGLKVATQTGCHTQYPSDVYSIPEDNPYEPTMLGDLCRATGATVAPYSRHAGCCGMGGMRSTDAEKSLKLFKEKLLSIKEESDPDMIITTCSSCFMQFDMSQKILKGRGEIDFEPIPTFYYTQVLALAMGFDPRQVAAISEIDRTAIIAEIQSDNRLVREGE